MILFIMMPQDGKIIVDNNDKFTHLTLFCYYLSVKMIFPTIISDWQEPK
ncbi:MAG: hypothetical protein V9819_00095 [Candidatus Dasytiphilus stammeri]